MGSRGEYGKLIWQAQKLWARIWRETLVHGSYARLTHASHCRKVYACWAAEIHIMRLIDQDFIFRKALNDPETFYRVYLEIFWIVWPNRFGCMPSVYGSLALTIENWIIRYITPISKQRRNSNRNVHFNIRLAVIEVSSFYVIFFDANVSY
jgi:hypothetical protein